MFIGREREIQNLEAEWQAGSSAMAVIYGRRRLGKTCMLERFAAGKDALFFSPEPNAEYNKAELADLARKIGIDTAGKSLAQILTDIFRIAKTRRLLFVIDEYPYLENVNPGTSGELQKLIAKNPDSRLFTVLCGSSVNFINRHGLGTESPFSERNTYRLLLEPFTFFESQKLLQGADFSRSCELYGLVGGTATYLSKLQPEKSLHENLSANFLKPSAYLYEEAPALLKHELEQPVLYGELLNILNCKTLALTEIMASLDIEKSRCQHMLENLSCLGIVKKISAWQNPNRIAWKIADCYFSFWHTFMPKIYQAVKNRQVQAVSDFVERHYNEYMEGVFREICLLWLEKESAAGQLPINATNFGTWWRSDQTIGQQSQIDIVGENDNGDMLFAECKWQNEPMEADQIDKLARKAAIVKKTQNRAMAFHFFSKSGFTSQMLEKAKKMDGFRLVNMSGMDQGSDENFSPKELYFKIQL